MKKWLLSLLRWGLRGKQARLKASRKFRVHRLPLHLEPLEQRIVMSTVTWDGQGDGASWNDPHNWVGGALPGAADDVVINNTPGTTVQFTQGRSASTACRRTAACRSPAARST